MSKPKHTPGPWIYDDRPIEGDPPSQHAVMAGSDVIAWVFSHDGAEHDCDDPDEVDAANARLIAAAPEMLEALNTILEFVKAGKPSEESICIFAFCEKAIAKATGGDA